MIYIYIYICWTTFCFIQNGWIINHNKLKMFIEGHYSSVEYIPWIRFFYDLFVKVISWEYRKTSSAYHCFITSSYCNELIMVPVRQSLWICVNGLVPHTNKLSHLRARTVCTVRAMSLYITSFYYFYILIISHEECLIKFGSQNTAIIFHFTNQIDTLKYTTS